MNKLELNKIGDVANKVVIVRVDFNVPLKDGKCSDDNRIVEALPTIKELQKLNARIVLLSHLGKVNHKDKEKEAADMKKNNMELIVPAVKAHIKKGLYYCEETQGKKLEKAIADLKEKEVLLVQNTRYEKGEESNDENLAKYWANLGDAYVNDAFGSAHRKHASTYGIAEEMLKNKKPVVAGLLVAKEVEALSKCVEIKEHPFVAILGGAKVSDKIKVIEKLLDKADTIIVGGAMAYTFLKAKGMKVGNSLIEQDQLDFAKACLVKGGKKIVLPIDHVIAESVSDPKDIRNTLSSNIVDGFIGLDIGVRSVDLFKNTLKDARVVFWNGPMGMFENDWFSKGTFGICQAIAGLKQSFSVVGGGDSAAAVAEFGFKDKFSHVSTGGGASLEMIENDGHLPCIDIIPDAK